LVAERLRSVGVPTAIHYPTPINRQPAFRNSNIFLPVGDLAAQEVLSLPMHAYLDPKDVIKIVRECLIETSGNLKL
jgi:UDP-2-acetamido-2-deoxy-ribo-hexuluronate aminotransferase